MASTFWPVPELREAKADRASETLEELLLAFEERTRPMRAMFSQPKPVQQQPAAPSADLFDRQALMPWAEPSAERRQNVGETSAGLFDRDALMPWAERPTPQTLIPGPDLAPGGTPIITGNEGTSQASVGPTPLPLPQPSGAGQGQIDNSSRQAFVRTAWPYMLEAAGGNQDAAEMMLAAAISENGSIGTGRPFWANNFFGIKGKGDAGSVTADTHEIVNGQRVDMPDAFAAYSSPTAGFRAFFDFLRTNPRYAGALQRYQQTGDASQLFRDVNAAGYATDPEWAAKVENIRRNQVAPVVRGAAPNAGAAPSSAPAAPPPPAAGGMPAAGGVMQRQSLIEPSDAPAPGQPSRRLRPAQPPPVSEVGDTPLDAAREQGWASAGALDEQFRDRRESPKAPSGSQPMPEAPSDIYPPDGIRRPPPPPYPPPGGGEWVWNPDHVWAPGDPIEPGMQVTYPPDTAPGTPYAPPLESAPIEDEDALGYPIYRQPLAAPAYQTPARDDWRTEEQAPPASPPSWEYDSPPTVPADFTPPAPSQAEAEEAARPVGPPPDPEPAQSPREMVAGSGLGLKPVWDAAGQVIGYVQDALAPIAERAAERNPIPRIVERIAPRTSPAEAVQGLIEREGKPAPPRREGDQQFMEQVRDVSEPIMRPGQQLVSSAATAAEQAMGAPEGAFRQAAEDVSNFFPGVAAVNRGGRPIRQTVEALREQLDEATARLQALRRAGDDEGARMVADEAARIESDLADALNARRRAEPMIRSEVGTRIEEAPVSPESAEDAMRAQFPDERVRAYPDELSGPVSIPASTAGRRNALVPFDPASAAAGSSAGLTGEGEEGEQEFDPLRAGAGALAAGIAGRRLRGQVNAAGQQRAAQAIDPMEVVSKRIAKLVKGDKDEANRLVGEFQQLRNNNAGPSEYAAFWRDVEERAKIKPGEVFSLFRRFNMLSGPRTFEVNLLSGGLNLAYEIVGQGAKQAARGRVTEAAAEASAPIRAAGTAWERFVETIRHGVTTDQAQRGDIPETLSSRATNPVARGALTVMETPDRLNAAVDQFFRTLTEEWATTILAHKQARAAGAKPGGPTWAQAVADAINEIRADPVRFPEIKALADRVTFSEEPGGLVKWLEKGKREYPNLIGFVAPFVRTPANIASRAVDISPFGIPRNAAEAAFNIGRGRKNLDQRVRDTMIGTAGTLWAYQQAQAGNITGAGPDDPEKQAMLRATGWQPFSIKIGDQYWSYANFAPFSLLFSTGAAAHEAQKYAKPGEDDALSILSDGAKRTGRVVTDMTVLAGIGSIVKSIQDPDRYGTQWLTQALQQLVPAGSLVNTIGQATDPYIRRAERDTAANQVAGGLQARIPGLRQNVPAAQDPLGRPVENQQQGLGALNPFRPTTARDDPAMRAFLEAGVDIGKPPQSITIKGRPVTLSPAEQRTYQRVMGEYIEENLDRADSSGDGPRRKKAFEDLYRKARQHAQQQIIQEYDLNERARESAGEDE